MSGNGQFPFRSSWFGHNRARISKDMSFFYPRIGGTASGMANTVKIWTDWFWGSTVTASRSKVWSGSAWVAKPTKVRVSGAWVVKPVKFWNGTAWTT